MSSGAIIIGERCFDCSKFVSPADAMRIGESVVKCPNCFAAQRKAIDSWADPPQECARCHRSFEDLARDVPGKPVSMFCHWMDSTFAMLCRACDEIYVRQRLDMYRATRFGWNRKL